jgi:hypothetical protein
MPRLIHPATRFSPAEWDVDDSEWCIAEGCGEIPATTCDVCSLPCCDAHSKVTQDCPVRDRICFDCLEAEDAMHEESIAWHAMTREERISYMASGLPLKQARQLSDDLARAIRSAAKILESSEVSK